MATTQATESVTYIAGADLSAAASQYKAVKLSAARTVVLCSADTDTAEGVLATGAASGKAVEVVISGIAKVHAGAAFSVGALLSFDSSGRWITAASGDRYRAIALVAATAAGDWVEARLLSSANLIA
jgi:hypothetical protein